MTRIFLLKHLFTFHDYCVYVHLLHQDQSPIFKSLINIDRNKATPIDRGARPMAKVVCMLRITFTTFRKSHSIDQRSDIMWLFLFIFQPYFLISTHFGVIFFFLEKHKKMRLLIYLSDFFESILMMWNTFSILVLILFNAYIQALCSFYASSHFGKQHHYHSRYTFTKTLSFLELILS